MSFKFDPNKSYSATVWDMSIAVTDVDTDDYVRNEDGSIKLFFMPYYDCSHICDDVDVDYLEERNKNG